MKTYKEARESSSKRFCKPHRMMLIQGDIKYGPKLPLGKNGAKVQTYLSSAIDDHSRFVIASKFYDNCEETIVEDTPSLPAAIQAMDKPETGGADKKLDFEGLGGPFLYSHYLSSTTRQAMSREQ